MTRAPARSGRPAVKERPMALSDCRRLYRRVLDAPLDDAPRLEFADYLEAVHPASPAAGHDLRAEFIRAQCGPDPDPDREAEIVRRCAAMGFRNPLVGDITATHLLTNRIGGGFGFG